MNGYGYSGPLGVGTDDRRGQKDRRVTGFPSPLLLVTSLTHSLALASSLAVNHESSEVLSIPVALAFLFITCLELSICYFFLSLVFLFIAYTLPKHLSFTDYSHQKFTSFAPSL